MGIEDRRELQEILDEFDAEPWRGEQLNTAAAAYTVADADIEDFDDALTTAGFRYWRFVDPDTSKLIWELG